MQREQGIYDRLSRANVFGVLKVFDFLRDEVHVGILLERADGSLTTWCAAHGPFPRHEVVRVGNAVLTGLSSLHRMDIVHRDIKPDNVMYQLAADGTPVWKLADFGIAKNTGRLMTRKTFQGYGTPGYMSPEQRNGAEAHVSADVYSVGKLFCWMLTGGTDPDAIVEPRYRQIVEDCVKEDADERPAVEDLIRRLADLPR